MGELGNKVMIMADPRIPGSTHTESDSSHLHFEAQHRKALGGVANKIAQ